MSTDKFIRNKTALITLIAACVVVLISLGIRQTFGLFFMDFKDDLGISLTEAGLSIGLQMLMWGLTGPIFGAIADKYGGHKAIALAFVFFIAGIYFLYAGPNTGIFFQIDMGILVGIGLGGTATVSYTHLRAHETDSYLVCRLLLEKKFLYLDPRKGNKYPL